MNSMDMSEALVTLSVTDRLAESAEEERTRKESTIPFPSSSSEAKPPVPIKRNVFHIPMDADSPEYKDTWLGAAILRRLSPAAAAIITQFDTETECDQAIQALEVMRCRKRKRKLATSSEVAGGTISDENCPVTLLQVQEKLDEYHDLKLSLLHDMEMEYQEKFELLYQKRSEILARAAKVDGTGYVPFFWLSALTANKDVKGRFSQRDAKVLQYLVDVKCHKTIHSNRKWSWKLEFVFDSANPFFTNSVLTKVFELSFSDGRLTVNKANGTSIHWKDGETAQGEGPASFFDFFEPMTAPGKEEHRDKVERDYYLCACKIIRFVVPHAVTLCLEGGKQRRMEEDV